MITLHRPAWAPTRRDFLYLVAGYWLALLTLPHVALAQMAGTPTLAPGVPATDQGTAAALTKFMTDLGRKIWSGEQRAPEWAPLVLAAIFGPIVTAIIALAGGVNLANGQALAGVIIGGLLAATGGAVLLTAMHSASRDPASNLPPALTTVPPEQRAQLCCTNPDCRTVRMAMTQAASGQPAVPVEAQQAVPTSPPQQPPPDPPTGPGVGVGTAAIPISTPRPGVPAGH